MAVTQVIFADVSTLSFVGTGASGTLEGANAFQLSRNADTRPIYAFNNVLPVVIVSSKGPGNGSFSFVASNGTNSAATTDWSSVLNGAATVTCSGSSYPTGTTQNITCSGCSFAGQSIGMNAKNEMQVNVNFLFTSGTW